MKFISGGHLAPYSPHGTQLALVLGPNDGVIQTPYFTTSGLSMKLIKSKNLLVDMFWKRLRVSHLQPALPVLATTTASATVEVTSSLDDTDDSSVAPSPTGNLVSSFSRQLDDDCIDSALSPKQGGAHKHSIAVCVARTCVKLCANVFVMFVFHLW